MLSVLTIPLILLGSFGSSCVVFAHDVTEPPPSVADGLQLTLPLILKGALNTAQFKKLQLELLVKDNARERIAGQLDAQLGLNLSLLSSQAQSASGPLSADNTQHYQLKMSHNKLFKTGTALSAEWLLEHRATAFKAEQLPDNDSYQSQFAFTIKQSLGRNRFGKAFAAQLDAARTQAQATEEQVEAKMEEMLLGIVDIYYRAWLLRAQLSAAQRQLNLQWRLYKVTQAKHELGTAEATDLLQSKNALALARQRVRDTEKTLKDIWYQLVIPMRLPPTYLDVEMQKLTLSLGNDTDFAVATCQDWQAQNYHNLHSAQLDFLQASQAALRQRLYVQKDKLWPDIFVSLRVANNGADASFVKSLNGSFLSVNPTLALTAGIALTLSNQTALVDIKDTLQQQHMTELSIEQAQDGLRLTALTVCERMQRLLAKEKSLRRVLRNSKRRVALLEERFNLGQVDVLSVIQAGGSVIDTELRLQETVRDMTTSAWKIRRNAGGMMDHLQSMLAP